MKPLRPRKLPGRRLAWACLPLGILVCAGHAPAQGTSPRPLWAEDARAADSAFPLPAQDYRAIPGAVYPESTPWPRPDGDGTPGDDALLGSGGAFRPSPERESLGEDRYPGRLLSYPDSTADLPPRPLDLPSAGPDGEKDKNTPPDARPGVFQKLTGTGTWLAPDRDGGLGIYELEVETVLALPFPLPGSHVVIRPGYGVHWLDGAVGSDLPPAVHDAWTQFRVMWPATDGLGIDVGVTPGVFSDFQQGTDEAIRIAGHGAVALTWTPQVKLVVGLGYLDREDVEMLPFGGIILTPCEEWRFEITAPRPKIARRLYWGGRVPEGVEEWLYVAGEWGGGSWAIRRASGANDVATLSDLRVMLGWERTAIRGLDGRIEVGYVFSRSVEYKSGAPDFEPSDTVMLRAGVTY